MISSYDYAGQCFSWRNGLKRFGHHPPVIQGVIFIKIFSCVSYSMLIEKVIRTQKLLQYKIYCSNKNNDDA